MAALVSSAQGAHLDHECEDDAPEEAADPGPGQRALYPQVVSEGDVLEVTHVRQRVDVLEPGHTKIFGNRKKYLETLNPKPSVQDFKASGQSWSIFKITRH